MNKSFCTVNNDMFMETANVCEHPVQMIAIGKKLREAASKMKLSDAEIARRIGISPERYGNYVRDRRQADYDTLMTMCRVLQVNPNFLFGLEDGELLPAAPIAGDGLTYDQETYVPVPVFDMRASAGAGSIVDENPQPIHASFYRLEWLRRVTMAGPDQLAVVRVSGDSMWDTLHDGDHVLIDRTQVSLRKEGLFVIDVEGEVYVKRCSFRPDTKRVMMRSDNPAYPTWDNINPDHVVVIGRVIWLGRHLG